MNGINNFYVKSLACVRIKGSENKYFRIDSGVRLYGIGKALLLSNICHPLLSNINIIYINSLACIIVVNRSELIRINISVIKRYHVPLYFQYVLEWGNVRSENGMRMEYYIPGLLFADDMVLYGALEEDL